MDAFYGEIRIFPYGYAPQDWALCDGSLLSIQTYQALYSVIGPIYGGDGRTNFKLPNLQGLAVMGDGTGVDKATSTVLTPRVIGQAVGAATTPLTLDNLPPHNHPIKVEGGRNTDVEPNGDYLSRSFGNATYSTAMSFYSPAATTPVSLGSLMISPAGAGGDHSNVQPNLVMGYYICLFGTDYPVRSS